MGSKMRFVVVGCGNIAQRCAIPALMQSGVTEVTCCVDVNPSKEEDIKSKFGLPFSTNLAEVLETYDFESVYISTPNAIHIQIIEQVAKYGKNILCEKPLAGSYDDALAIAEIGIKYNVPIFEGFMYQFHAQHKVKNQLISDGAIGRPFLFQGWFGFPPLQATDFRYSKALGGGCVLDACAYLVHSARHFYGCEPLNVYAVLEKEDHEVEIRASILMDFGQSRTAVLVSGFNNKYKSEQLIWGTEGLLRLERAYALPPDFHSTLTIEKQEGTTRNEMPSCNHFIEEMQYYVTHVSTMAEPWREEFLAQSKVLTMIKSYLKETE